MVTNFGCYVTTYTVSAEGYRTVKRDVRTQIIDDENPIRVRTILA